MNITGKTKFFAVIGDPVSHSLSPAMHNAAFEATGVNAVFLALKVRQANLGSAVEGMKSLGFSGFNVTVPHKEAVMSHLDEIDGFAEKVGAVNTVTITGAKTKGFNTDVQGFKNALTRLVGRPAGLKAVIIGSGGAAKAVVTALEQSACGMTVLARHPRKAKRLLDGKQDGTKCVGLNLKNLEKNLQGADLLVNATPVGLNAGESPIPPSVLSSGLAVFDLVYRKGGTRLVKTAQALGCRAIDGREMLLFQGMKAFEIFTGKKAPEKVMRTAVGERL